VALASVDKGGSEVNDLDLIEILVLLEQHVLGLKISVYDLVLVAVVNARQDLLDQDCRVFLGELSSCDNLVEELAALADPIG
jgi:hypothetical protein